MFAIGRHVRQKGFDILLRAYAGAALPGRDLLLAGDGPEKGSLEKLAAELGLGSQVHFLGRTDRKTTASLFAGCEWFVLPSREEPFGIVNLEAMAAGKAIIATRVGGVPEIVADGVNGILVEKENVAALAAALRQLAGNPAQRAQLGAAGRTRAQQFAWPNIAERYAAVYTAAGG